MRIISDFHDYYDCVQSQGQDQSLIYVRKEIKENWEEKTLIDKSFLLDRNCYFNHSPFIYKRIAIGFCGKTYPLLMVRQFTNLEYVFCYTIDDIVKFVELNYKTKQIDSFYSNRKGMHRLWNYYARYDAIKKYFKEWNGGNPIFKHPIFVLNQTGKWVDHKYIHKIIWNAKLSSYEFFRVIEPYTAFQELSMYIGRLASPQKEIPAVSDKDMIMAKGFDKYSFRKGKQNE